ncbi:MAG: hypothetical protein HFJ86_10580 [Oscillospiraceae bacterium]|nr:hypothetical protein [Oscillospiraceae bacterium]
MPFFDPLAEEMLKKNLEKEKDNMFQKKYAGRLREGKKCGIGFKAELLNLSMVCSKHV